MRAVPLWTAALLALVGGCEPRSDSPLRAAVPQELAAAGGTPSPLPASTGRAGRETPPDAPSGSVAAGTETIDTEPTPPSGVRLEAVDPSELDRIWAETNGQISAGPMARRPVLGSGDELSAERALQRNLPIAGGPHWDTFQTTRITLDPVTDTYRASHPAVVTALGGRTLTLRGYMVPLEAGDRTTHFLISPYTPVCYFHPPAEANEMVEVKLNRAIPGGYNLVEVTGVLRLSDKAEESLFFVLDDAEARIVHRIR